MKIKVNGNPKTIVPVSDLTFDQFNSIIFKNKGYTLTKYLPIQLGMTEKELEESNIDCPSIALLHSFIFNVDIEKEIKRKRETVSYKDDIFILRDIGIDTFGKSYLLELKKQTLKDINEISIYALALAICNTHDSGEVDVIFRDLKKMNWKSVLPPAFFLLRNISKKNRINKISLIGYILALKKITFKTAYCLTKYQTSQKKLFASKCAKDLM